MRKFLVNVCKICFFVVTFIAYWFCLDEKYYHEVDRQIEEKYYNQ